MRIEKWISDNCSSLKGKLIAISGASGDLGKEACMILASLGANLLLLNRNKGKSNKLKEEILKRYNDIKIKEVIFDLEKFSDVKNNIDKICGYDIDVLILNAGAYKIERRISDLGYDNVFQINFISQYYIAKKVLEKMLPYFCLTLYCFSELTYSIPNNYCL
jgi:short-subunit dehydrogenase